MMIILNWHRNSSCIILIIQIQEIFFHTIPNDNTFHKHLHQITKQLLVGSLRYLQLTLIQFLLSDNFTTSFTSKTIDLRTEDACCRVALYNITDDFHLDNVLFYVYDFTAYCKKFVTITKIESLLCKRMGCNSPILFF